MFNIRVYEADGFESSWKNEKNTHNEGVQTTEFTAVDQDTSTISCNNVETQTEKMEQNEGAKVDVNRLATWLKTICPNMLNELKDTSLTSAMASMRLNDQDTTVTAHMVQLIECAYVDDQTRYVSSLSWNTTGNTLAVAYCNIHETWCHHKGLIHLYTFDREAQLPALPNKTLNSEACITCVAFHSLVPSIICAGTFSGEVYLWNIQNEDEHSLITSIAGHEDRVSCLSWVCNIDSKKNSALLATAGLDSYLVLWEVDVDENTCKMKQKFTTGRMNYKKSADTFSKLKSLEGGIVAFDFSPHVSGLFVLGTETGTLAKCSLFGAKTILGSDALDPSVSAFEKHEGAVNSVEFSPHRKELFLSCGADHEIRIFHIEQTNPVQVIFMEAGLCSASWLLQEAQLLLGCGPRGSIRLYSLRHGQLVPHSASSGSDAPFYTQAVNTQRQNMVVFGDAKGTVHLWSIPWNNIARQDSYSTRNTKRN